MYSITDFSICDSVVWDMEVYPQMVGKMIDSYGKGPFRVVGLRLHVTEARAVHPLVVTVEVPSGRREELAGEWFKKVT